MVRLRLAVVSALGVLLVMPQAAAGGGWWSYIDVNRSHVAPGERVEVDEDVTFGSVAAAEAAERTDRFYVYLLRDFDYSVVERAMRKASPGDWWSLGGAVAIEVGRVSVRVSDANVARATAAFTVPELPPATYRLMLCDASCSEPLADVIPAEGFTVAADTAAAREGRGSPPAATGGYAGWLVAGIAGALAVLVLRRRRARPPRPAHRSAAAR